MKVNREILWQCTPSSAASPASPWTSSLERRKAAIKTSEQMTSEGRPVRYIRSTFIPEESRCTCLFEAGDAQAVQDVNDRAQIPYTRVVEALDLTP